MLKPRHPLVSLTAIKCLATRDYEGPAGISSGYTVSVSQWWATLASSNVSTIQPTLTVYIA